MTKKVPTQTEAVEQANQISANSNLSSNDKPAMLDPIAYREDVWSVDFDPKKLQNADVNISQYWDDSSAQNYNNSNLWGWENQKYSWENTKNSQVAYNKDATLEWLNPNYKYWQAAQMANSAEANYIAKRNDEIASALYNAGKTSMQDVSDFLNSQEWFRNSVENERQNTLLSVWKRLGDIAIQNQKNNEQQPQGNNSSNNAVTNMENDLNKGTTWELYWKVTADDNWWSGIKTLEDNNSVYKAMNEARIRSFKDMQAMSSESIAASVVSWVMASDTQTMRDLMQYDPAKYQEVQNQIKALRWQMNINAIASWEWEWNTSATNGQWSLSNEKADFISSYNWTNTNTADLLKSVNSSLSSNVAASSAQEQLTSIENDMSNLQNRMKNLKAEAKSVFKWDVPQYIVNAYIANRRQEIQDQLSVLETRYNAAYSRYQDEWERTKWDAEFDLKRQELSLKQQSYNLDEYVKRQWVEIDWFKAQVSAGLVSPTIAWWDVPISSVPREEIEAWVDSLIQGCQDWTLGKAQCAAWIQKYYLPYLWVDLGTLSAWSAKQGICNEDRSYTPQKWDLIVMEWSKAEYWHIGIVTWINQEAGTIQYLDWNGTVENWTGTETAALRSIPISNNKVYGYYNPTKVSWWVSNVSAWDFTTSYWKTYNLWNYQDWNWLTYDQQEIVKWILNYSLDPSALPKSWAENWKALYKIKAAVSAISWWDFNESDYKVNYNIVNKFNTAQQAWWELSRNATAMDELRALAWLYEDLGNRGFKARNATTNFLYDQFGDPTVAKFNAIADIAASEIAWALKGNASPTEQEIQNVRAKLWTSLSKSQYEEVIQEYAQGIFNKAISEANNYEIITWRKPSSIYVPDVAKWLQDSMWIDTNQYFWPYGVSTEYIPDNWYSIPSVWEGTDYSSQM